MRANTARWLQLKTTNPDLSNKDIAKELGIAYKTLENTLRKARREGWLKFHDPLDDFKYGTVPLIAENMELFLKARDKQVTIEAFKATLAKEYAQEQGVHEAPTTILALKIELPDGYSRENLPKPKGVIVARPHTFVEVVDAETVDPSDA